ncbi:MAG TPA: DUF401 family protein [Thermoplasmatales archaeon]|nr:DUF401 family protein [Thermoplasmatales archaeon]
MISFSVVIILARKKWNFGVSLLIGSLIVAVFSSFEVGAEVMIKSVLKSLIYSIDDGRFELTTIKLAFVVLFIISLANLMQRLGSLEKLVNSLRKYFSGRALLGITPAVIGLLHVPGGALFSAPIVDEEGKRLQLSREKKALLNVWFRHIWFLIYPLSTSIILISSRDFADLNIYKLILVQLPTFFVMIVIGLVIIFRSAPQMETKGDGHKDDGLIHILPIVTPIVSSIALTTVLSFDSISALLVSLPIGILVELLISDVNIENIPVLIKNSLSWKLPLAIVGIMVFRGVITSSNVVSLISNVINSYSLPALPILIGIPFLLGFVMGYNLGAIALSYPIMEPLFSGVSDSILVNASILYVSSFIGYLISPLHLCMVVTNEYFEPDLIKLYKDLIPISLLLIAIHTIFILTLGGTV